METTPPQARPTLTAHTTPTRALPRALRPLAAVILFLLLAQFVVGMVVNLYVQLPPVHPGTQGASPFSENLPQTVQGLAWALAHGEPALRVHVALGLFLGLTALIVLALAIAARRRAWVVASLIGFLAIVGAGVNGVAFLNAGGHAINSLAMSVNFLLALVAYAVGFYLTHSRTREAPIPDDQQAVTRQFPAPHG